jgi:hypothetical protein
MSIRRITISVPEEIAGRIKKAAGDTPVSAWVTDLIEDHLNDAELDRQWDAFYREAAPKRKNIRRADAMVARLTRPRRSRGRGATPS